MIIPLRYCMPERLLVTTDIFGPLRTGPAIPVVHFVTGQTTLNDRLNNSDTIHYNKDVSENAFILIGGLP